MVDKVKAHICKHKVAYSVGTIVVISGIAYYIGYRSGSTHVFSPNASIFGINCKLDQKVIAIADRQGPPSWIIGKVGSDLEWQSQRSTAISEGLREADLSAHLNGLLPEVNGARYFRKGLAAA